MGNRRYIHPSQKEMILQLSDSLSPKDIADLTGIANQSACSSTHPSSLRATMSDNIVLTVDGNGGELESSAAGMLLLGKACGGSSLLVLVLHFGPCQPVGALELVGAGSHRTHGQGFTGHLQRLRPRTKEETIPHPKLVTSAGRTTAILSIKASAHFQLTISCQTVDNIRSAADLVDTIKYLVGERAKGLDLGCRNDGEDFSVQQTSLRAGGERVAAPRDGMTECWTRWWSGESKPKNLGAREDIVRVCPYAGSSESFDDLLPWPSSLVASVAQHPFSLCSSSLLLVNPYP
ncbi:uncharacterized protein B0H18DRAFT_1166701 [Fomitopsis serialis]|uniref:uncharacterized protein n=1 Tax=Fomitopsis serialis TaxID=139415 RepID=UPI00200781FC|nr:uncharacterized protein B0H18DRAFT_1166701 [Neoantrodia serialis]KAH9926464.1 hypothetical protein B0H18DRAFT_1166701 [Neoantrodia serialis]